MHASAQHERCCATVHFEATTRVDALEKQRRGRKDLEPRVGVCWAVLLAAEAVCTHTDTTFFATCGTLVSWIPHCLLFYDAVSRLL